MLVLFANYWFLTTFDFHTYLRYREENCDVTKIHICEIMGLVSIFRKNKTKKVLLQKNQLVSGEEI